MRRQWNCGVKLRQTEEGAKCLGTLEGRGGFMKEITQ